VQSNWMEIALKEVIELYCSFLSESPKGDRCSGVNPPETGCSMERSSVPIYHINTSTKNPLLISEIREWPQVWRLTFPNTTGSSFVSMSVSNKNLKNNSVLWNFQKLSCPIMSPIVLEYVGTGRRKLWTNRKFFEIRPTLNIEKRYRYWLSSSCLECSNTPSLKILPISTLKCLQSAL